MQCVKIQISKEVLTPSISQEFEGVLSFASFKFAGNEFSNEGPLCWQVNVVNAGEGYLFVTGNISCKLNTKCVRCLENASIDINAEIEGYVKHVQGAKLPENVGEDECVELIDGKYVDLTGFIEGAITLNLPISPLCNENCKGLFEYCDLTDDEDLSVQHPFEVLKNLDLN